MELCQELLALKRNINRFERCLFEQYPISTTEHIILTTLSAKKTATSNQLAEILKISKSAVRKHVSALSSKGYISNLAYDSDDHRSFNLALTTSGYQLLKEIDTSIQQVFEGGSSNRVNQLIKDLRTLNFSLAIVENDLYNK